MATQSTVRPDHVPVEDYICKDFLKLENENLWPRVWLAACRETDLAESGSYHVFDIVHDSILLVRQASGAIKAFHNICPHRGRRLMKSAGKLGDQIYCLFHGWAWNPDGSIKRVVNREEWAGCAHFDDKDVSLIDVRVDTWGGWVWIAMDPQAPSLLDYLGDAPDYLDCFEMGNLREIFHINVPVPANWKLVLDSFNEGYHVEATHSQTQKHHSTRLPSEAHGQHAMFGPVMHDAIELPNRPAALAASRKDPRITTYEGFEEVHRLLGALYLDPGLKAAQRLIDELPEGTDPATVAAKFFEFNVEEVKKTGAVWPEGLNAETARRAGFGWHLFPNFIALNSPDGALFYRTRPDPENPDMCIWDIWSFGRFAPGAEPEPKKIKLESYDEFFPVNRFLYDDLVNMPEVQRGMHAKRALPLGLRTNPVQEVTISNFHRALREFIGADK